MDIFVFVPILIISSIILQCTFKSTILPTINVCETQGDNTEVPGLEPLLLKRYCFFSSLFPFLGF